MSDVFAIWYDTSAKVAPSITLRSGCRLDDHMNHEDFDPSKDQISDEYLRKYICGLTYLDFSSLKYYLPYLITYAESNYASNDSDVIIDGLLETLKLDRFNKERLVLLSLDQKRSIIEFLKMLYCMRPSYYIIDLIDDWNDFEGAAF